MNWPIVDTTDGVTLIGATEFNPWLQEVSTSRAQVVVAADGGADRALAAGLQPAAVVGDLDSISALAIASLPANRLHRIAEQDTTDFDKALRSVRAPFVLALGFAGARIDHALAVFNALVRHADKPCLVLSETDVVFHGPPRIDLRLEVGDRISLFPMARLKARSEGLRWPLDGIVFSPDGRIGTSNEAAASKVRLAFDAPGMLVILPIARLDAALKALVPGWREPPGAPQPRQGGVQVAPDARPDARAR